MDIGILGGTGPAGSSLALRLASAGHSVWVGSRDESRASQVVVDALQGTERTDLQLFGGTNLRAADCELVVVATPWDTMLKVVEPLEGSLAGKTVISMANALMRVGSELQAVIPVRGSAAQTLQASLRNSRVVAALHHVPAKELGRISAPIEADVLVCSDFEQAGYEVVDLLGGLPGMNSFFAGSLAQAGPIEAMTGVLVNLNIRYKTRVAIRVIGIPK